MTCVGRNNGIEIFDSDMIRIVSHEKCETSLKAAEWTLDYISQNNIFYCSWDILIVVYLIIALYHN